MYESRDIVKIKLFLSLTVGSIFTLSYNTTMFRLVNGQANDLVPDLNLSRVEKVTHRYCFLDYIAHIAFKT